jgi:hypothetical protein
MPVPGRPADERGDSTVFFRSYLEQRKRRAEALEQVFRGAQAKSATDGDGAKGTPGPDAASAPGWAVAEAGLPALFWQAHVACAASALRHLQGQLQLAAEFGTSLIGQALPSHAEFDLEGGNPESLVSQARTYLSRLADLSLREARTLQLELERIGDAMAEQARVKAEATTLVRHWRAKS